MSICRTSGEVFTTQRSHLRWNLCLLINCITWLSESFFVISHQFLRSGCKPTTDCLDLTNCCEKVNRRDSINFWWLLLCADVAQGGCLERTFNSTGLCLLKSSLRNWKCLFSQFQCSFNSLLVQHIIHRDGNASTAVTSCYFSPPTLSWNMQELQLKTKAQHEAMN